MSDNATPHAAAVYDRGVRQTIPFYETIHAETIDLVRTARPDVSCWLDTGCGTGYLIEKAWDVFPQARFVLADPSAAMLAQAAQRLAGKPADRLVILPSLPSEELLACGRGSGQGQVAPQVITAVLCHHYLQADQRRAAVQACYQLLDRDGLLVVFENVVPDTTRGTQIGLSRWAQYQLGQCRSPQVVEGHIQRFGAQFFPIRVAQHLELLREAGFGVAELFWQSHMQAGFYAIK